MAGRHALLIGISSYGEGLEPIPSALLDVEALREVLQDPELGGIPPEQLRVLIDPDRTGMEIEIESFYANKEHDDLLLLYFSGHGFRDEGDRQLLLSTRQSKRVSMNGQSRVQRATTLPASIVRRHMEESLSRRQVVILDCCFSGFFAEGMKAKDAGTLEIEAMLGGKGRAVLTSSDAIETSRAPSDGEGLSLYTRFLVEGIQTGAADRHDRGYLEAEDLHHYAKARVKDVAPTMTPQFIRTEKGDRIRVCQVRRDPSVRYRQKVQELAEKRQGNIIRAGRAILQALQAELGLDDETATRIETEVLQPFRDYQTKLTSYRDTLQEHLADLPAGEGLTEQDLEEFQELSQRLKLRASDVAAIHQNMGIPTGETPFAEAGAPSAPVGSRGTPTGNVARKQPQDARNAGPSLLNFTTKKGTLVREGKEWQIQTEPLTVSGHEETLAERIPLRMIEIPAGSFEMGSPKTEADRADDEGPQHRVELKSFFLGQTPVTQAQWQEVASWPKKALDLNPNPSHFKGANRPVEQVSWEEAMEFCRRLSERGGLRYTLPSEAQWEYACRAGTTTPFSFGETLTPDIANYDGNYTYEAGPKGSYRKETTTVADFPANAWGLHDMHGNVLEWCLDVWHPNHQGAPIDGSSRGDGIGSNSPEIRRLLRGGSWIYSPRYCRSAYRGGWLPGLRASVVGFRLCGFPPGRSS
jgi:formylglycine-generating enzyme required for sulfatase activity